MQVSNIFGALKNVVMNPSSVFLVADFGAGSTGWFTKLINFVMNLFYAVLKWVLYFVDIVFSYVQQLAGLNMRWDSLDSVFSADSDMVFNLLWSSKETVLPIIKALIVLAIVLIIFFSIVAIIKTSFESLKGSQQNQSLSAIKTALKAFVLMLLTPMMALVGIVASNAILQTLYNATNPSGAISIGSQVFSAASASANSYRIYANNNYRIPIMYDFTREDEILEYYSDNAPTAEFLEYLKSSDNITYSTYMMFKFDGFFSYDSLNNITGEASDGDVESYYTVYDVKKGLSSDGDIFDKYRRIQNYKEEYYVMADVVDFCVRTTTPVYFKTIEQILESIISLGVEEVQMKRIFDTTVSYFGIKFLDNNLEELPTGYINASNFKSNNDWRAIRWVSNYMTGNATVEPNVRMPIQYTHLRNAENGDELEGAKYIIAMEKPVTNNLGVIDTYFYPLTVGDVGSYDAVFTSSHILRGQMISAKGIFEDGIYPTAIKQNSTNDVQFYRDKIESSVVGVAGQLFGLSMQDNGKSGVFSSIVRFFRMLFDPDSLVPKLDVDFDAVTNSYTAQVSTISTLYGGKMHISYMFGDVFTKGILKTNYVLPIDSVFQQLKINYLILVFGAMILFKVSVSALFMLINRAYELFLIIIVYPTACATIPLENGGYDTWVKNYTNRLFGTYGTILGINFVLLLFPVINSIHFFDPSTVGSNLIIKRIGGLFFAAFTVSEVTNMLNFATAIMFQLVLFTMLSDAGGNGVSKLIGDIVGGDQSSENPLTNFGQTLIKVGKVLTYPMKAAVTVVKAGSIMVVPSQRKKFLKKAKDKAIGMLPMSSVISASKDKINLLQRKSEMNKAKKDLKNSLKTYSTDTDLIQKQMQAYLEKQKKYTKALANPHEARETQKSEAKRDKELGISSRESDDPNELGVDTSELSKKELKRLAGKGRKGRKLKRGINKLEKKAKKEKLSEKEEKTLETYSRLREQANEELQNRKGKKQEFKDAEKKFKNGEISSDEYLKAKDAQKEFKKLQKGKGLRAKRKNKIKDKKRFEKQQKKQDKRDKLFRHTDRRSRKKQNKVLGELDRNKNEIKEELKAFGFDKNLDQMSNEEIIAQLESKQIDDEHNELIQDYLQIKQEQQRLMNMNKNEYAAKADYKANKKINKDAKFQGYTGANVHKKNMRNRRNKSRNFSAEQSERLSEIDEKIKQMEAEGINGSNAKKYRSLLNERNKLNVKERVADKIGRAHV